MKLLTFNKIVVQRKQYFLYFILPDGKKEVRYNLQTHQMEKYMIREKIWRVRDNCYRYFESYNLSYLVSEDKKFINMLYKVERLNPNCYSISTFIKRLKDALIGESYEDQGIEYECTNRYYYGKRIITKPLNFYNKHLIKIFKKINFKVTVDFEKSYEYRKNFIDNFINIIYYMKLEDEEMKSILKNIDNDNLHNLINEYKYDITSLIRYSFNYLKPFENVGYREGLRLLYDYYRMGHQIGRKLKKYPKYLKSMHDIILANYNAYKKEYDEVIFKDKIRKELEFMDKRFCIIVPKITKDIIKEGTNLNHCVSSYVEQVIDGKTYIAFLRDARNIDESLVTLEFKNEKLIQAKGSYNRDINSDEKEFLNKYCLTKNIKIEI